MQHSTQHMTTPRISIISPRPSHTALTALAIQQAYAPMPTNHNIPWLCDHFCAPVIHPVTGTSIIQYKKLKDDPATGPLWTAAFGKEFGNLTQGDNLTNTPGTDAMFILSHEQIANIPRDHVITYARIVVDYRPQKQTQIKYASRLEVTSSNILENSPQDLWI